MNATQTKTRNTKAVSCPKCSGSGYINGMGHIANGVCFACKGAKTITIGIDARKAKISDASKIRADWIMASTPASYSRLSYGKLAKIRDFAHGGNGLQDAYPTLLAHYFEAGEPAYQAAQKTAVDPLGWVASKGAKEAIESGKEIRR